jgi:hypothetical protein
VLPDTIEDTPIFRATVSAGFSAGEVRTSDAATQTGAEWDTVSLLIENIHEVLAIQIETTHPAIQNLDRHIGRACAARRSMANGPNARVAEAAA